MPLFSVDPDKCRRDGICAATCPMGIIAWASPEALPSPAPNAAALCIQCGHCVAVCPHGALSLETVPAADCLPLKPEQLVGPDQLAHFLRARRSIRTYTDRVVARERLTRIIDIARFAPSGHNSQPVRWRVIYGGGEVRRLAGIVIDWMRDAIRSQPETAAALSMPRVVAAWEAGNERICRGAPHVIVAHAPKALRVAPAACTIALTYLELAAFASGLGACWAGYFNAAATLWPPMQAALDLPEGDASFGALLVGYPRYPFHRLPPRREATVTWR